MQDIGLIQGITSRMDFLNQRQRVLAQNIANADTPGYQPSDLREKDFSGMMKSAMGSKVGSVAPARTDASHLSLNAADGKDKTPSKMQKTFYETTPTGNSVVLEEQLLKTGQTMMNYTMMANLYQKQMGLFQIALGKA